MESIANFYRWPRSKRIYFLICSSLIFLILIYVLYIQKEFIALKILKEQHLQLKHQLQIDYDDVQRLLNYKKQLQILSRQLTQLKKQSIDPAQLSSLFESLSKIAVTNGLLLKLIKPLPEIHVNLLYFWPIQMILVGDYHQIAGFLEQLEFMSDMLMLDNFSLTPIKEKNNRAADVLIMKLKLYIYNRKS